MYQRDVAHLEIVRGVAGVVNDVNGLSAEVAADGRSEDVGCAAVDVWTGSSRIVAQRNHVCQTGNGSWAREDLVRCPSCLRMLGTILGKILDLHLC